LCLECGEEEKEGGKREEGEAEKGKAGRGEGQVKCLRCEP